MNNLLNLEKAYNVRHLGGYTTKDGKITNDKSFLRADSVSFLSDSDIETLLNFGLGTVIDLRSADELASNPNPFASNNKANYVNLPLKVSQSDSISNDLTKLATDDPRTAMPTFYVGVIKNSKGQIKELFEIIESNLDKTILFHCTAGKDRTGITAMLLLGLCDVPKDQIIENYVITYENNIKNPNYTALDANVPYEILLSDKEYILAPIEYIENNYDSYYDYLLSTGLSKETLDKIKNAMLS